MTREHKHTDHNSANASGSQHMDGRDCDKPTRSDHASIAMGSMGCQAEYSSGNDELIGRALKSVYHQTVNEELPSEFQDLLDKLH